MAKCECFYIYRVAKPGQPTYTPELVAIFLKKSDAIDYGDEFVESDFYDYIVKKMKVF